MAIRDMLVTIDETKAAEIRLDLAGWLANRFRAHLTGLHPTPVCPVEFAYDTYENGLALRHSDRESVGTIRQLEMPQTLAAFETARAGFERCLVKHGRAGDWRRIVDWGGGEIALRARYVDLAVVGQLDPADDRPIVPDPAEIALGSSCPVLVVPYDGRHETIERHALIAWDGSREARRAVHDALPLLKLVRGVTILSTTIERGRTERNGGEEIAVHLARHGLNLTVEQWPTDGTDPADLLLSRAIDQDADLIVLGAHGHSGMRDMTAGGTTRSMLKHMTVPLLISH
jgi:nucleotide-binding universal stress UspA family protein